MDAFYSPPLINQWLRTDIAVLFQFIATSTDQNTGGASAPADILDLLYDFR